MAVNDYKPFATGGGALVTDQASYVGLADRLTGFGNGIAEPAPANKAWRQSSVVASMIGQFCANKTGLDILDDGDVDALLEKFISALDIEIGEQALLHWGGTDTGAANAYVFATPTPNFSTIQVGTTILGKVAHNNTGPATVSVLSEDPYPIKRSDGSNVQEGDLVTTNVSMLVFDGTNFILQMTAPATAMSQTAYVHYAVDSGVANAMVATAAPTVTTLADGLLVLVKVLNANTGATTLNLSGLGIKTIWNTDGSNLASGTLPAGSIAILVYVGSGFQFLGTLPAYGISYLNAQNGYERMSNGRIMAWGKYTGSVAYQASVSLSWPITFAAPPHIVIANTLNLTSGLGSANIEPVTVSTTGCTFFARNHAERTGTFTAGFHWIAIGW